MRDMTRASALTAALVKFNKNKQKLTWNFIYTFENECDKLNDERVEVEWGL